MSDLINENSGTRCLIAGNDAIARGALEAGLKVAAGYPGTPSSEIIEGLAAISSEKDLYVEWSVNEKVALEVAAAGSFAGLRSICVMKQVGVNVAADFMLHLAETGTRAGMVLVSCEDPGALSSTNEGDSRGYAKMMEVPLIEPGDLQEAKDMTKWAFELSEELRNLVMLRSVTRLSHASGDVVLGELPEVADKPYFKHQGSIIDPMAGPIISVPVDYLHRQQQGKLKKRSSCLKTHPLIPIAGRNNRSC
jgi:indolepyruvate ferredoxin oxidoreductase alpha subunit